MFSTEAEAVWRARLNGYDRFRASLIGSELVSGYTTRLRRLSRQLVP